MASLLETLVDLAMIVILLVVTITGWCAVYIALAYTRVYRPPLTCNKHVVPGFPCDGTLMVLARDGVMYIVPDGKAVVKCGPVVREVHGGRIAKTCDQQGRFEYVDRNENHEEEEKQDAISHVFNDWPFDSPRSQDMTPSETTEEESELAGEMVIKRFMI